MPGMTITRLPYTDYIFKGGLETLNYKGSRKPLLANYTTSNNALKSGRVPTTVVGNVRLS